MTISLFAWESGWAPHWQGASIDQFKKLVLEKEELNWSDNVTKFSKLELFSKIKPNFATENYLKLDLDRYDKSLLSQFRYDILPIEVETGRYKGLNREERKCTLCKTGEIEDQLHFALYCESNDTIRTDFFEKCRDRIVGWDILTDVGKISQLFSEQPRLFGKFLKKAFLHRKSLLFKWPSLEVLLMTKIF